MDITYSKFVESFNILKNEYNALIEQIHAESQINAPEFNVFEVLNLSRNEVKTHSAMLANLLDPKGSHAQGELFLKEFINTCSIKYPTFIGPGDILPLLDWEVEVEKAMVDGRLDVVVSNKNRGYVIVIENKVDAPEQPDQLSRYSYWLKSKSKVYPNQSLLYLTIHGSNSSTAGDFQYFPISYHTDIKNWLEHSFPEIQSKKVRYTLKQYIDLVAYF